MENLETWRPVKNYESQYEVSSFGSIKRNRKILKPWIGNHGYYLVSLSKYGCRKVRSIHQLVAESFLNHKPNGYISVVNHIDFNKLNNCIENLEIVSQRKNSNKKHITSSSSFTGVSFVKNLKKWKGQIVTGTNLKYLGLFETEIEAHEFYKKALISIQNGDEIIVKKPKLTSKFRGVSWNKNTKKWRATININGKQIHLGLFENELKASEAYNKEIKNYDTKTKKH